MESGRVALALLHCIGFGIGGRPSGLWGLSARALAGSPLGVRDSGTQGLRLFAESPLGGFQSAGGTW
ncbi:hypothetical protein GUJ93_ZPchr0006g43927 [Zizania palustris]|uniref:Uncharacterized protein n=1 Tax=Zizania palustris TaxID=103762 RepID=A0A8J5W3N0_ZIZPA|nr:hypothetical protein GUJ93_ZPchr0006g43927 [Zizania palustris]